jgi:hypothetical protein
LHVTFRKNRSRSRTKIWFVNAPGLPPAFRSGRAVPRSGLHCRQAATPPLFNHQAPQPPASSGGFKRRSGFYKVAKILPETWRINHTRPRAKLWFVNAPAQAGCLSLRPGRHPAPNQGLHSKPTRLTSAIKIKSTVGCRRTRRLPDLFPPGFSSCQKLASFGSGSGP